MDLAYQIRVEYAPNGGFTVTINDGGAVKTEWCKDSGMVDEIVDSFLEWRRNR